MADNPNKSLLAHQRLQQSETPPKSEEDSFLAYLDKHFKESADMLVKHGDALQKLQPQINAENRKKLIVEINQFYIEMLAMMDRDWSKHQTSFTVDELKQIEKIISLADNIVKKADELILDPSGTTKPNPTITALRTFLKKQSEYVNMMGSYYGLAVTRAPNPDRLWKKRSGLSQFTDDSPMKAKKIIKKMDKEITKKKRQVKRIKVIATVASLILIPTIILPLFTHMLGDLLTVDKKIRIKKLEEAKTRLTNYEYEYRKINNLPDNESMTIKTNLTGLRDLALNLQKGLPQKDITAAKPSRGR